MISRLLNLHDRELQRLLPFFGLYLLLFAAFSLADGMSLALYVKEVGGRSLPQAYGAVAVANIVVIGVYVVWAERFRASRVFQFILAGIIVGFSAAWIGLHLVASGTQWYSSLFVCREIAFVLILMHFGTFLQDYFTRDEMNRVLPLIYSGGRIGGVLGGMMLEWLAEPVGLLHLIGVFIGMCGLAIAGITLIDQISPKPENLAPPAPPDSGAATAEENARRSYVGFLQFVWQSPLLFWITLTTLFFFVCRWILNYQYSSFFGTQFEDAEELAEFLGRYTQLALLTAIAIQLLLVNRLIAWIGLRGTQLIYAGLLLVGTAVCLGEMTISLAIFARFVESELRLGLRNPIYQLIVNNFPRSLRIRVRAWSFGLVIPVATLCSSIMLASFITTDFVAWIPWLGLIFGIAYLLGSIALTRTFQDEPKH